MIGDVKKFNKAIKGLQAEMQKLTSTVNSEERSFGNRIRPHLIRSNVKKYLVPHGNTFVPASRVINLDSKILEAFYGNVFPADIEGEVDLFESIIKSHHEKHSRAHHSSQGSIETKLAEQLSRLHSPRKLTTILQAVNRPLRRLIQGNNGMDNIEPQVDVRIDRREVMANKRLNDLEAQFEARSSRETQISAEALLSPEVRDYLYAKQCEQYLAEIRSPSKKKIRPDLHRAKHDPLTAAVSCTYTSSSSGSATPNINGGNPENVRKNIFGASKPTDDERYYQEFFSHFAERKSYESAESGNVSESTSVASSLLLEKEREYLEMPCKETLDFLHRESIIQKELAQKSTLAGTSTPQKLACPSAQPAWHTPQHYKDAFNVKPRNTGNKVESPKALNLSVSTPELHYCNKAGEASANKN